MPPFPGPLSSRSAPPSLRPPSRLPRSGDLLSRPRSRLRSRLLTFVRDSGLRPADLLRLRREPRTRERERDDRAISRTVSKTHPQACLLACANVPLEGNGGSDQQVSSSHSSAQHVRMMYTFHGRVQGSAGMKQGGSEPGPLAPAGVASDRACETGAARAGSRSAAKG